MAGLVFKGATIVGKAGERRGGGGEGRGEGAGRLTEAHSEGGGEIEVQVVRKVK